MPPAALARPRLQVSLGSCAPSCVGLPVLAGGPVEHLFGASVLAGRSEWFELREAGDWLVGLAVATPAGGLEEITRELYRDLLQSVRGHHLARIWNYVPAINAPGPDHLENYRSFCRGRSLAFEQMLGPDFKRHVPAASAVGTDSPSLAIVFAAATCPARHIENPRQVPAYDYPPDYGPRAPSFARASVVDLGPERVAFISGTSAVTGHATIAPGETGPQVDCTLRNLQEIVRACGFPQPCGTPALPRRFKVYLRHAADLASVRRTLAARLLQPDDEVIYLRSDVCRADLNVEIEATLMWPVTDP